MKTKNEISVILIAFLFVFSIPILGQTPSAINNDTNHEDTVAPQSASDPVVYKWNSTWGLKEYQDWGNGIALDSSGNVYIVGETLDQLHSEDQLYDICLVKFDSSGVILWNRTWGGIYYDEGKGIALDSSDNVYIVGWAHNSQMILLKYDSSGVLQWIRTRSSSKGFAITLDSSDNIYITGTIGGDIGLVKYDSAGVEQWIRTWGGSNSEEGKGVALDSSGNIYIVGTTRSYGAGSYDACLVKFDSSGVLQWYRTWGGSGWDEGKGVALDSSDNIYITGQIDHHFILAKYSGSGVQVWNRIWGGGILSVMSAVTVDSRGYIYLAGELWISSGKSHMCLVIYDHTGVQRWNRTWGDRYYDRARALALDSSDNIYIAGDTTDYIDIPIGNRYVADICLLKFESDLPPPPPENTPPITIPGSFTLSSDADSPDIDGNFTLTWSISAGADNYSIYTYQSYITEINSSLTLLAHQNATTTFPISGLNNGMYYYIIVAYNKTGYTLSNSIFVNVNIPPPPSQVTPEITGYDAFLLLGILSVVVILLSKKLKTNLYSPR